MEPNSSIWGWNKKRFSATQGVLEIHFLLKEGPQSEGGAEGE